MFFFYSTSCLFLEPRAEIFKKIFVFFVDLKTPKRHCEIDWPLLLIAKTQKSAISTPKMISSQCEYSGLGRNLKDSACQFCAFKVMAKREIWLLTTIHYTPFSPLTFLQGLSECEFLLKKWQIRAISNSILAKIIVEIMHKLNSMLGSIFRLWTYGLFCIFWE